jgi:hypothetical protein
MWVSLNIVGQGGQLLDCHLDVGAFEIDREGIIKGDIKVFSGRSHI